MQAETGEALERREEIASFESVDGGFIGPAHLAASLGHVGDPGHPTVVAAVADVIRRTRATGKPAGNLTTLLVWC